jgi:hypothetical protein
MQKKLLQHIGVKLNIIVWRYSTKAIYCQYIYNRVAIKAFLDANKEGDRTNSNNEAFNI